VAALAVAGVGATPEQWSGYREAARLLEGRGCRVPGALLAGAAESLTYHGAAPLSPDRSGVAALTAFQQRAARVGGWLATGAVGEAGALGHLLCASGGNLTSWRGMAAALNAVYPDAVTVERVAAAGRRYAVGGLGLGEMPRRPYQSGRGLSVPAGEMLPPGDVGAMMAWGFSQIGVPYSQCIGRPQDPVCPPGTTRYGAGFFDCSGFVAAAYARIGVPVPLTTYAMEDSEAFMATKVADHVRDLTVLAPGDVLLSDGHVMLYAGGGNVLHSSTGGVKVEAMPAWAWYGVFVVLRPVS
jgi:hypothetical protein